MSHSAEPTGTVTGRYRRPPTAWLWLALPILPLLAALLHWFALPHAGASATTATAATTTATAPATATATRSETVSPGDTPTGTALTCTNLERQIERRLTDQPVHFDPDSARIDEGSRGRLTEIGAALTSCHSTGITVHGHTDATGTERINDPLSRKRADAVRDVLVAAGMSAQEITTAGCADDKNVASNDNPTGRGKNRRVEIRIENEGRS